MQRKSCILILFSFASKWCKINMSCTAEEIAAKKRIALERLKAKKQSVPSANNSAAQFVSSNQFYGSKSSNHSPPKDSRNSFKAKSSYANCSRVNQPYQKNVYKQTTSKIAPVFVNTITCTCALLSESHFTVVTSRFNEVLINAFKTIASSSFGNNQVYICRVAC